MRPGVVRAHAYIALQLPSDQLQVIQVVPNTYVT